MSYNVNISKEITMEIYNSIPAIEGLREATKNYEEKRKEELFSVINSMKYQMERASRKGEFSCEVLMDYKTHVTWDLIDLKDYLKSILIDLGYKVELPRYNIYLMIISW